MLIRMVTQRLIKSMQLSNSGLSGLMLIVQRMKSHATGGNLVPLFTLMDGSQLNHPVLYPIFQIRVQIRVFWGTPFSNGSGNWNILGCLGLKGVKSEYSMSNRNIKK